MVKCYIGVGSNIGDRRKNIFSAIGLINLIDDINIKQCSRIYETKPWGYKDQRDFFNAVLEIETRLSPEKLLSELKKIEKKMDRKKCVRWGPRAIDLDILFYGMRIISGKQNLRIPHNELQNREFVLRPLVEIAGGGFRHPVLKKSIRQLYRELK